MTSLAHYFQYILHTYMHILGSSIVATAVGFGMANTEWCFFFRFVKNSFHFSIYVCLCVCVQTAVRARDKTGAGRTAGGSGWVSLARWARFLFFFKQIHTHRKQLGKKGWLSFDVFLSGLNLRAFFPSFFSFPYFYLSVPDELHVCRSK